MQNTWLPSGHYRAALIIGICALAATQSIGYVAGVDSEAKIIDVAIIAYASYLVCSLIAAYGRRQGAGWFVLSIIPGTIMVSYPTVTLGVPDVAAGNFTGDSILLWIVNWAWSLGILAVTSYIVFKAKGRALRMIAAAGIPIIVWAAELAPVFTR